MSFLTNLFGNTKVDTPAPINFTPPGFNAGGLNASFSGNGYSVTPDANRSATVGGLSDTYGALGDQYGALAKTVTPGGSAALNATLTDLGNKATAAIGNLKQNLQSRRILGSSFGQDTLSRLQATQQQTRDQAIAQQYQTDLQNSTSLIGQQYQAYAKSFQTGLDELNLEASTASGLTTTAATLLAQNAQLQSKLNEQASEFNATMSNNQASGFGSFLGKVALAPMTGGGSLIGNGISSLFGGGAAAGAGAAAGSDAALASTAMMAM